MDKLKDDVMNFPETSHETEKNENDSDGLEQSESTENPTETISPENENTLPADDSNDDSDYEEADDWDDAFYKDESYSECIDEDEIDVECGGEDKNHAESIEEEKELDSEIREAALQASENIIRSSLLQSYDDPVTLKKSALQSISENLEFVMFPVKIRKLRDMKESPIGQSGSNHKQHISEVDKPEQKMGIRETLKKLPQMKDLAKIIPVFINQNIIRAETVPGASKKITSFSSVPITEKDEPHNRKIPNWPKKRRPKSEINRPPPVPPRTHRTSNISLIQKEEKTAPVQSIAGVSKQLEQPFLDLPQKEDQKLLSASSKEETTAHFESIAALPKQLEQPSLMLPPKKNPKFTTPTLAEEETAPVKSIVEVSEKLEKLALIPPQNGEMRFDSSVLTEENIVQVESADDAPGTVTDIPTVPVNQDEDLQNIPLPIWPNGEPPQQTNEILENNESLELLLTAIQSLQNEQTAPVELISEISEEVEPIPPVLPVISDNTSIPSILTDEKTAQEIQSLEASEGCEKPPLVFPRTKFLGTDSSTRLKQNTVQIDIDLAQLGEVVRKIKINEETRLNEQNKVQSNSAEQVPPVPQEQKFLKHALPLLLKENGAKADSIGEALKQIGYMPSPSLRPENASYIPLIPIEEYAAQEEIISDEQMKLTYFSSVPVKEKDVPHNRCVYWPRRKTEKHAQKPMKKTKRLLPPAVLKIKYGSSCTSHLPTEETATLVELVSDSPKALAQAPSVSFSSENPECSSPVTLEKTAHTSPTPSKSMSETEQSQSIPQKPQNVVPDSTSPPAEDEWKNFKISDEEFKRDQSTELGLPEAKITMESDVATISRPEQNVVVLDGVPILDEASSTQLIPFTPSSSSIKDINDSYSMAEITHDEYHQELSQKKIKVFRAFRKNIPKEDYICDLIGVQVYQWTSCAERQQPCDKFCRRCNFCCHQFYCTCTPCKFRALSWCKHIHAAIRPVKNGTEPVVFVMDTWQMSQPPLAHLRAMCYDLDNVTVSVTNAFFLVKEFSNLRAKVTRGNRNQRCGDCYPKNLCSTCDICFHVYKCVCNAFRRGEMCEHCHVVALYEKKFKEMFEGSESSRQASGSSRISKQASNSGGTSMQASGSGRTSDMALDSNTKSNRLTETREPLSPKKTQLK